MVHVPLPAVRRPKPAVAVSEPAVVRRKVAAIAVPAWLRKLWPSTEKYLPADVTIPGEVERRAALRLAAVPVIAALASLVPVLMGHANLFHAPRWALAAVFLAVLQLIYAAWMVNVPDWVSARVQMVVCAAATTIYGMVMTLTMTMPPNRPLSLDLGEIRHSAPGWCGLIFLLMGAATWFCGRTSAEWRRGLTPRGKSDGNCSAE